MGAAPELLDIQRENGIAGQYAVKVTVRYPGEETKHVIFVGSSYGGPIVMVTSNGVQTILPKGVTDRIGSTVDSQWVVDFFADKGGA